MNCTNPRCHRERSLRALFVVLAAVAAACSGSTGSLVPRQNAFDRIATPGYCASATHPPYPPERSRTAGIKTPIRGLLDLGQTDFPSASAPPNTLYFVCGSFPAIDGLVVNDTWADVQPNGEDAPLRTGTIDAALAAVDAFNRSNPTHPIGVRLRIVGGIDAPQWAKEIGGPIPICDAIGATPQPGTCPPASVRTAGAYWTPPYQQAWSSLQHRLAAKYDANPVVAEVSVTSCASFGDEEFLSPTDEWTKAGLFEKFHYSNAAFERCLTHALDAYGGWHRTIVDDIVNPFYEITPHSPIQSWDLNFTKRMMRECVRSLGPRCMLDNQEMGKFSPPPVSASPPPNVQNLFGMWQYMAALSARGVLVAYQTASPGNLRHTWGYNRRGWNAAATLAMRYGASSLELWPPEVSTLHSQGGTVPCTFAGHPQFTGYTCVPTATLLRWGRAFDPI